MNFHKTFIAAILSVSLMGAASVSAEAQTTQKKGWSKKGKGAAIGAGAGAATGAVIAGKGDRGKGALIGGAAGAVGGAIIGRKKDKKKDPVRYDQYSKRD
ncbi:YMGG-like glycine zipper-containing protein [Hymenobacter koreensis]|uniref:YMGG-like Gly-zipper domain-containing protein n=1 Tax=Hymenobacter koreensis TaxID=1084523 RepID=A0ABP8IW27_9BACT